MKKLLSFKGEFPVNEVYLFLSIKTPQPRSFPIFRHRDPFAGSEHESAAIPGDVDTTEDVAIQLSSSKPSVREWTLAFLMLGLTVGTTITASQLTNLALTDKTMNFHAPFLFVVFKCLFRTLAFPLYLILNTIIKLIYGRKLDLPRTWRYV